MHIFSHEKKNKSLQDKTLGSNFKPAKTNS